MTCVTSRVETVTLTHLIMILSVPVIFLNQFRSVHRLILLHRRFTQAALSFRGLSGERLTIIEGISIIEGVPVPNIESLSETLTS